MSTSHQLGGDGEAGAVLLGQFNFDSLCILDRLQRSGQVLWSHLQTDLVVLRGHALHLVLIEEVGLRGGRTHRGSLMVLRQAGYDTDPSPSRLYTDSSLLLAKVNMYLNCSSYLWQLTPHADSSVGHFTRQDEEQVVWSQAQDADLRQLWDGGDDSWRGRGGDTDIITSACFNSAKDGSD